MFKRITAILLIVILVFTISLPVIAISEDVPGFTSITGTYLVDGKIDWSIHVGGVENGTQQKSIITGKGLVDRTYTANMSLGKLEVTEAIYLESVDNLKMISVAKVGFNPADVVYAHDQIYAFYLKPYTGAFTSAEYTFIGTHGYDYIDSFIVDIEMAVSRGSFARYIGMSTLTAKSPYVDDLFVDGTVSVNETFKTFDILLNWYDMFLRVK